MPASPCVTVEIDHAKDALPPTYFNLGNAAARTGAAQLTSNNLKTPGDNEPDNQQKRTSRLVATNHYINDVDWLQGLNEQTAWIQGDPIHEISNQLRQRNQAGTETSELHIIAHGGNGAIKLGNTFLTGQYLEESAHLLQEWKLEAIYLWSCEAGRNTELIKTLGKITGADVYTSTSEINSKQPNLSSSTGKEASLEALIGIATLNRWSGKLASTQVLDANYQQLVFDHTNYNTSFNNPNGSLDEGDVALFKDVITIGGQAVDALFKLTSIDSTISLERLDDGGVDSDYISMDLYAGDSRGGGIKTANAEISFYEAGTYTGSGTGNQVTLENIVINSYDIDASQHQILKGFQSYEVANNTQLTISTQSDGSVKFDDAIPSNPLTSGTQDESRARVYYDAIDKFEIEMGTDSYRWVLFYFDFQQGPAWTGDTTITDTPAANFTWSTRNLTEASANVGSFAETATITFNHPGSTIFAGSDGDTITHTATNVPAGLTTVVTRASDTTATITVTGNATNHTTSDDLNNIELEFENSAFVVGSVGASTITDARITNFGLSFIDDTTRPTIAISSDVSSLKAGETAAISFTLSETSTNFVESDITVNGGELSNFSGSGTSYSATFTPATDSTTNGVIHVANDKFSDAAGNTNQDESDANNTVTLTVDTARPTIAITDDDADNSLSAGDTSRIAFTLSEAATDFAVGDIDVTGGTLSDFSGSGANYTATFTPTADSTTNGVIHVANDKFSDAAGNTNQDETDANNTVTFTVDTTTPTPSPDPSPSPSPTPDTVRPKIAITDDDADNSLSAGDTSRIAFTLSEAATDFAVGDIDVTGGTLSDFSGSGANYTATFTPTADSTTNGVIHVANDKFSDAAGNTNQDETDANNTVTFTVDTTTPTPSPDPSPSPSPIPDTVRPKIAITDDDADNSLSAGDTSRIAFTLSEAATDFAVGDIDVTGGTLSDFSGSGANYTATFTPTADSTTNGVIHVANDKFSDAAGNTNQDETDANNTVTFTVDTTTPTPSPDPSPSPSPIPDTVRPKIAITDDDADNSLSAGDTSRIAFTLSEAATDFAVGDIDVTGGTLSDFSGSGANYTATFTPTADSTTNGVIHVANDKFSDAAGNTNQDETDANNTVTFTVDTTTPTPSPDPSPSPSPTPDTVRPKIAITDDDADNSLSAGDTSRIAFTLSEAATDFAVGDIDVTGGTLSDFSGSGANYTATFTPTADSTTNGVIHVANDKFSDAAGNTNQDETDANNTVTFTVDTTTPTPSPDPSPSPSPSPDPSSKINTFEMLTPDNYDPVVNYSKNFFSTKISQETAKGQKDEIINFGLFDTYGSGMKFNDLNQNAEQPEASDHEGGVKLVKIDSCYFDPKQQNFIQLDEEKIGVFLTKQPDAPMTVKVNLKSQTGLEIANYQFTFSPENWQIPQIIEQDNDGSSDTPRIFTAKADNAGGFKGTESDKLKTSIQNGKSCRNKSISLPNNEATKKINSSQETSMLNLNYSEFNSPFFLTLKALLHPFFLVLGMTNALLDTISRQHQHQHQHQHQRQQQSAITQPTQNYDAENEFAPNTFIENEHLIKIFTPIIEEELSTNNEPIEPILLGPAQIIF